MKKHTFNGVEYVKVGDLRRCIGALRLTVGKRYSNFDSETELPMVQLAYTDIVKELYKEELANAHTPDEIKAILEIPGDYIVVRKAGKKKLDFFAEWDVSKRPVVTMAAWRAMIFNYKSKAQEIADAMGDGWYVLDITEEECGKARILLNAIFKDDEEEFECGTENG